MIRRSIADDELCASEVRSLPRNRPALRAKYAFVLSYCLLLFKTLSHSFQCLITRFFITNSCVAGVFRVAFPCFVAI